MKLYVDRKLNYYIRQRSKSSGVFGVRRAVWQLKMLDVLKSRFAAAIEDATLIASMGRCRFVCD